MQELHHIPRYATNKLKGSKRTSAAIIRVADYSSTRKRITRPLENMQDFMYGEKPKWSDVRCVVLLQAIAPMITYDFRWICIEGVDMLNMRRLAIKYRLHPLALEDVLQGERQRPKLELYEEHYFVVVPLIFPVDKAKILQYARLYRKAMFEKAKLSHFKHHDSDQVGSVTDLNRKLEDLRNIVSEPQQVSIYVLDDTVITVQETPSGIWDIIKGRLRESYSKLRNGDATFLLYSLLDIIVDEISPIMNAYGARLMLLELQLTKQWSVFEIEQVQLVARQLTGLQRTVKPLEKL